MGAGYGALSGAVFGGISKFGGKDWNWKVGLERTALATVTGGGISILAGGSFEDGAMFAGIVSGADFVYSTRLKRSHLMNTGITYIAKEFQESMQKDQQKEFSLKKNIVVSVEAF